MMENPQRYSGLGVEWAFYAEKALTRACKQALITYLADHPAPKLQLGSSYLRLDGWFNTDVIPSKEVAFLDSRQPFPFEDSVFAYVFSEHQLEHVSFEEGLFTLRECYRVLQPDGKIRLAMPDLTPLLALFSSPEPNAIQRRYMEFIAEKFIPAAVPAHLPVFVINNAFQDWGHKFLYDQATLQWSMEQAGFVDITRTVPGESEDEHLRGIEQHGLPPGDADINNFETMVLEGRRPTPEE
jgi:SAM-dependent methyltransferase